uniref:Uncharacterized protein n=1 Tax=Magallana gigas TaxID=29159 RepID=A0A8W8JSE2_MAGGI
MKDLNALSLIESQKERYTSLIEKLKSGEDLPLYNEDVQFTTDRTVRLCTDIQRYINAIQDEIQALNEMIKSFTIHLGEKMKQLVESKYFEDTNTKNAKMFKSEDNDKNNVVTSHLQLIGIKSSIMSGDTKAKEDARYYRQSDQGYHKGLCCVVTVVEGNHGFKKEDLTCVSSDSPNDLKRCSENREEIVGASVVKIRAVDGFQFELDVPMRIFVPYVPIDIEKEIKLKISIDGSKWTYPEKITPTANLNEINVALVGTSLLKFNMVEIAVVSRPKRESHVIKDNSHKAAEIRPSNNENFIVRVQEGTFKEDICAHLKVDAGLASRVSSDPDFNHIRIATPLFGVEFDEYTQNDVALDIQPNYIKKAGKTDFPYY